LRPAVAAPAADIEAEAAEVIEAVAVSDMAEVSEDDNKQNKK